MIDAFNYINDIYYDIINKKYYYNNLYEKKIIIFLEKWFDKRQEKITIKSSGTNKRKKIFFKKKYMINSSIISNKFFRLKKFSKILLCLPMDYIAAIMLLVRSIIFKWKVYCIKPNSNPLFNIKYNNIKFDFSSFTPFQAYNSISYINEKIKILLIGGGSMSDYLINKLNNLTKTKCYLSYGMTETLSHIAIRDIKKHKYYKVLYKNIILNTDKKKCLNIFLPYINIKVKTRDIVNIIKKKKEIYLEYIGRFDNIINSGGIKIYPEILEKLLSNFIINIKYFIIGKKDKIFGNIVTLFIESKSFFSIKVNNDLFNYKYKIFKPREIYFVPKFIFTNTGKINKKKTYSKFFIEFEKKFFIVKKKFFSNINGKEIVYIYNIK
ncbi:o-succinylbenzoate--CoA ligase [Candidatus Shikimatogenerans silvanidophilus]|uniref:o-succinylbenzoate--CoA ligase n=1 Tax=Candidatus Shikimatogenerans silvanidophilus TaxID=2782547 RepID=UPI001BA6E098|nr:o-succinylbenzoate--CoA ligase [Candidatus Shikimatogenerans silvanidophilus]